MPVSLLIVEDESIVALDLENRLTKMGYSVVGTAATGEVAERLAEEHRPDVILMDIQLRGESDGIDAAGRIRAQFDIPVIFLTAYSDETSLQRARESRAYGYLLKPFQERDLSITIDFALYKHAAERELRLNRKLLDVTVNSIRDGVVTTDESGGIVLFNRASEELTGWSAGDALGRDYREVIRTEPIPMSATTDQWVRLIARDDARHSVHITESSLQDGVSSDHARVMVIRDVAREREQAERLVAAKEAAEAAAQAKTDFLSRISHELRTPLNSIQGMAQLIRVTEHSPKIRDFIDILQSSVESLGTLITDVLDYADHADGRPPSQRHRFDPVETIELAGRAHALEAETKGLRLVLEVDPAIPRFVVGDGAGFARILRHIISNAVKFTEHGHVVISASLVVEVGLQVAVEDTGPGIAPEAQTFVFEDFSQIERPARRRAGGVGLGLAIVRQLVTEMAGTIELESDPGSGTRLAVTIPFPLLSPAGEISRDPPVGHESIKSRFAKVITDDELLFRAWQPWCAHANVPITVCEFSRVGNPIDPNTLLVTAKASGVPAGASAALVTTFGRRASIDRSSFIAELCEPHLVEDIVHALSGGTRLGGSSAGSETDSNQDFVAASIDEHDQLLVDEASECFSHGEVDRARDLLSELRSSTASAGVAEAAFRTLLSLRRDEISMTRHLMAELKKELSS